MNSKTDKFTMLVYCKFLVLLSTTVCSQNINKQNVNIVDETLTAYSFLSRYHHTKSKNYLKRRYRIRHWIPMFIGTPCRKMTLSFIMIKLRFQGYRRQLGTEGHLKFWYFKQCTIAFTLTLVHCAKQRHNCVEKFAGNNCSAMFFSAFLRNNFF